MNLVALVEILNKTTRVVNLAARKHPLPDHWRLVDFSTAVVAVDVAAARDWHDSLVYQLRAWPSHLRGPDAEMSYTDALELLQEPRSVYRLFALGEALELWQVRRPSEFVHSDDPQRRSVDPRQAALLAGSGALVVTHFRPWLRNPPQSLDEARRAPRPPH